MSQDLPTTLPTTSYALLSLLTLGDDLTGYELKQRADRTMRFYWVSPAMSQVYTELARLADRGLVEARGTGAGRRRSRYRITAAGRRALSEWMHAPDAGFPVLKHPVALRLMMGALVEPGTTAQMLRSYLEELAERRADLQQVRDSLQGRDGVGEPFRYPSMVADWGLEYFDSEREITEKLLARLDEEPEGT